MQEAIVVLPTRVAAAALPESVTSDLVDLRRRELPMTPNPLELSRLIGDLYEAALAPNGWAGVAPRLAASLNASSAVVKLLGAEGLEFIETTDNFEGETRDVELAAYWHQHDLWVDRSTAAGFGRVVVGHELTPFSELQETGYYRDWLRPLAIRDMVGGVVQVAGGIGVLGIHRGPGEAAFGASERIAVQALLPHLERALRIGARLHGGAGAIRLEALSRSELGVILVEPPRHRVAFINAVAERMLARDVLSVRSGRLVAKDSTTQARLDAMLAMAWANGRGESEPPPSPVALPRREGSPMIVSAAPYPEQAAGGEPRVLVVLREVRPTRPDSELMRTAFGLTRGEAAVAAALCAGSDLRQIGTELSIGMATVRSHLKRVLFKTQTRRQAELVALLASLPSRPGA